MRTIPLTKGKTAIVDDEDYQKVVRHKWYAQNIDDRWYANTRLSRRKIIAMHRLILGDPKSVDIDHKNRNGLDNRRDNLRIATRSQNNLNSRLRKDNTSGVKGISKHGHNWRFEISKDGKRVRVGGFRTIEDALSARRGIAAKIAGDFYRE